jgi:hypothetical protein
MNTMGKKSREWKGMSPKLLRLHKEFEPFRKANGSGWDFDRAVEESPACRNFYYEYCEFLKSKLKQDNYDAIPTARFVDRLPWRFIGLLQNVDRDIKKGYLRVLEPEDYPGGYIRKKDVLGNVSGFNALFDEVRGLIESGEKYEDHKRELWGKYHSRFNWKSLLAIKETWDWIAEDTKELSPGELEALRNCESLRPWSEDENRLCKIAQAKSRDQEKIRRAAISA